MRRLLGFVLAAFSILAWVPQPAAAQVGAPLVGLEATVVNNNIIVSWTGTEEDEGHEAELLALGGYTLFGSLSPGGAVIGALQIPVLPPGLESPFQPSTVIPGVPNGTFWIVAVKGLTTVSTGPASAWVKVVINVGSCGAPPGAPMSLQNLPTPGVPVALSWTPDQAGCTATRFLVAAGTGPGLSDVGVVPINGAVTILQGTAPAGTYHVRVHAENQWGVSGPSNEVHFTVGGCAGPGPPQSLVATVVGNNQLQLNWSPPASGDLTHLTGYRLIGRVVSNPLFGGMVDLPGPGTSLLTGPIASNTYEIQVQAISVCPGSTPQLSAPSVPVTVVVP